MALIEKLRYGENPHQKSSIYINSYNDQVLNLDQIHGKQLSYNNYNDIFSLEILFSLKNRPSTVIIKHANPCGVSVNRLPIYDQNGVKGGNPIIPVASVRGNFKINKIKLLNSRWIQADFSDGDNWGELIIEYFFNQDNTIELVPLSSFLYSLK